MTLQAQLLGQSPEEAKNAKGKYIFKVEYYQPY